MEHDVDEIMERLEGRGLLDLVAEICREHHVPIAEVLSRRRNAPIAAVRKVVWAELYHDRGLSYPDIGRLFGRDHSTVLFGVRQVKLMAPRKVVPIVAVPEIARCA